MYREDTEKLRSHLQTQYAGIFDERMIQLHIDEYVNTENAAVFAQFLVSQGHCGKRMLDIGSGYGSNVLASRNQGIDAVGIEIAEFEVEFARCRLRKIRPDDDPERVYRCGDGTALPFDHESFDVVTIMNVLEHVPDYRWLLSEAIRVLQPNGVLYALCPNYAAFRQEAHYHVPWLPLFPRQLAKRYLELLGRNPVFFEKNIFYCTNWGILNTLSKLPVSVENQDLKKLDELSLINNVRIRSICSLLKKWRLLCVVRFGVTLGFYNPFKHSVNICAIKERQ